MGDLLRDKDLLVGKVSILVARGGRLGLWICDLRERDVIINNIVSNDSPLILLKESHLTLCGRTKFHLNIMMMLPRAT